MFFFGAPHAGLDVDALVAMVEDTACTSSDEQSARLSILEQLRENSEFLEDQKERLIPIWERLRVVSFYEAKKTPSVKKVSFGLFLRSPGGAPVLTFRMLLETGQGVAMQYRW